MTPGRKLRWQQAMQYSVAVLWSEADWEYMAFCIEIPTLTALGPNQESAVKSLRIALAGWLEYLQDEGLPAPQPQDAGTIFLTIGGPFSFGPPEQADERAARQSN